MIQAFNGLAIRRQESKFAVPISTSAIETNLWQKMAKKENTSFKNINSDPERSQVQLEYSWLEVQLSGKKLDPHNFLHLFFINLQ
jgi:hypothetical protein